MTFSLWLRRGASPAIAALGILSLVGFAVALTRVDTAFAGEPAARGGIYIAASLVWPWLVEGQQPTTSDMLGAALAVIGALVSSAWQLGPDRRFSFNLLPRRHSVITRGVRGSYTWKARK